MRFDSAVDRLDAAGELPLHPVTQQVAGTEEGDGRPIDEAIRTIKRPGQKPNSAPPETPRTGAAGKQAAVATTQHRKKPAVHRTGRASISCASQKRFSLSFLIGSQSPTGENRHAAITPRMTAAKMSAPRLRRSTSLHPLLRWLPQGEPSKACASAGKIAEFLR